MNYEVRLSRRAAKDLDGLSRDTRNRNLHRLEQLAMAPLEPRFSSRLTNQGGLRKSRVGGWLIIFAVDEENKVLNLVTVERRGQVYHRI